MRARLGAGDQADLAERVALGAYLRELGARGAQRARALRERLVLVRRVALRPAPDVST